MIEEYTTALGLTLKHLVVIVSPLGAFFISLSYLLSVPCDVGHDQIVFSLDLEAQKLIHAGNRSIVPIFHCACMVGIDFCPESGLQRPALFDFQLSAVL